jgi:hypothetical protein
MRLLLFVLLLARMFDITKKENTHQDTQVDTTNGSFLELWII